MIHRVELALEAHIFFTTMEPGLELMLPCDMSQPKKGGLYYCKASGTFVFFYPATSVAGHYLELMAMKEHKDYMEIMERALVLMRGGAKLTSYALEKGESNGRKGYEPPSDGDVHQGD